jgi:hypothetical protein
MSTSDEWLDTPANRAALLTILRQVRTHLVRGTFTTLRISLNVMDGTLQRNLTFERTDRVRVPEPAASVADL